MSHRNAPLTPQGRLLLCRRIEAGTPIAHVAAAMGISRRCASKWWHRYLELGVDGLCDRSSRPLRSPRRLSEHVASTGRCTTWLKAAAPASSAKRGDAAEQRGCQR